MPETENAVHVFDAAVELTAIDAGRYTGNTHPAYANMVGPFGGVTAATMLRAIQLHPEVFGTPLSLTVNYAAAIQYGEFEVVARPVRTNRSSQHWAIELSQDGSVTTTATAVFGNRRDTWASTELAAPAALPEHETAVTPFPDFVEWGKNYEMRFVEGPIPGLDAAPYPDSISTLWVRDQPARPLDFTSLTALCDVFYPRAFLRRGHALPAGTVTLTIYFHADATEIETQRDRPILATARSNRFGQNYFDQTAHLWSTNDTLLATAHQLVYFKA
ncbi:acyl-CoA thioesterase [Rhodococcus sp. NPDC060090]|uniref:acyl-CoA thioesterase n=1 Tax=Rhodococcus sp. NPDC060090 TaxID=3347056 RepID=UPI00364CE25C